MADNIPIATTHYFCRKHQKMEHPIRSKL
ncbi:hypothetical protein CCACVL1_06989 [Corchorus capsularis]|uniref:Uncharacterized protein n=1 Tax=Corchorus capsularis TaxID=210143 RepID=A0A1R3JAJ9_COCAP|nr:hypothetical protein CCACVL1_06989 [Corchorus capsularis]